MKKQQFPVKYAGNKYKESTIFDDVDVDFTAYDTIVEPFGGTFGFSRWMYDKGYTNKQYIIYDNDHQLIELYKNIQAALNDGTLDEHIAEYNEQQRVLTDLYRADGKKYLVTQKVKQHVKEHTFGPICTTLLQYWLKSCRVLTPRVLSDIGWRELFKCAQFIHCPFEQIPDEVLQRRQSLVYYDPPYLVSINTNYMPGFNIDAIFTRMFRLFKNNDNQLLVHEKSVFLDLIMRNCCQYIYDKKYGFSHRETKHCIYYKRA